MKRDDRAKARFAYFMAFFSFCLLRGCQVWYVYGGIASVAREDFM